MGASEQPGSTGKHSETPDEAPGEVIAVDTPRPGETAFIKVRAGQSVQIKFDPAEAQVSLDKTDLLLEFANGGRVVLQGFLSESVIESKTMLILPDGSTVAPGQLRIAVAGTFDTLEQVTELEIAPAAGAASPVGAGQGTPPSPSTIYTARGTLFTAESEEEGYSLYSYLLFQRGDQSGENYKRRVAAIRGFIDEIDELAALEAQGVPRKEINIFYVPLRPFMNEVSFDVMRIYLGGLKRDESVKQIIESYDFARSRLLLQKLDLMGDGPYIVSYRTPISGRQGISPEQLLVQDLSRVPPELVRLWIIEFKRQVVQERSGKNTNLRRFTLRLRTEIAILAKAFHITKEAVASMIGEPK